MTFYYIIFIKHHKFINDLDLQHEQHHGSPQSRTRVDSKSPGESGRGAAAGAVQAGSPGSGAGT